MIASSATQLCHAFYLSSYSTARSLLWAKITPRRWQSKCNYMTHMILFFPFVCWCLLLLCCVCTSSLLQFRQGARYQFTRAVVSVFMPPRAQIWSSLEVSWTKRKTLQCDSSSASLAAPMKGVSGCCFQYQTPARRTAVRRWHAYCIKILFFSHLAVTVSWQSDIDFNSSDTCRPEEPTVARLNRII